MARRTPLFFFFFFFFFFFLQDLRHGKHEPAGYIHRGCIGLSRESQAEVPAKPESVAGLQYTMLHDQPYRVTSDDLLFAVHARRNGIVDATAIIAAREAFFARPQACLRTSPLAKRYGWGIHYDAEGRVAIYGVETGAYRDLLSRTDLKQVSAMRNRGR